MNIEEGFLQDIRAHPGDDAPRLIFADWFDDHGDMDRAEFIRLQCRLALLDGQDAAGEAREKELLTLHAHRWVQGPGIERVLFRRGFLEGIAVNASWQPSVAFFERHPIQRLSMEGATREQVTALLARPDCFLAPLEQLDLDDLGELEIAETVNLVTSPYLADLRSLLLEIGDFEVFPSSLLTALANQGPRRLKELGVAIDTDTEDEPLVWLLSSPRLAELTALHLPFLSFGADVARLIAHDPIHADLLDLDLGCCNLDESAWEYLLNGPNFAQLRWLGLFGARVVTNAGFVDVSLHSIGDRLHALLGEAIDTHTSSTFPRWKGFVLNS